MMKVSCVLTAFLEAMSSENTVKRSRAQLSSVGEFISSTQELYKINFM